MNGKFRTAVLGILTPVLLAGLAGCSDDGETELVTQMEASLRMPEGAGDLKSYARFYVIESKRGQREVRGVLLKRPAEPGVHIVKANALPVRFDGGCGVVNVHYSPSEKKFLQVACNGGE